MEFRTIPAPANRSPEYNGIDRVELHDGGRRVGNIWQHVCGFSWAYFLSPEPGHYVGGGCASIEEGRQRLLDYHSTAQEA